MPIIKIDDKEYDTANLSKAALDQLTSLQLTEVEIQRLTAQLAIARTARNAYARALAEALPKD
jgi:hypothetical protein